MPRFRLLPFLVAMLVAGVLLGVNFHSVPKRFVSSEPGLERYLLDVRNEYGWPLESVGRAGIVIPDEEFRRWRRESKEWDRVGLALDGNVGTALRLEHSTITRESEGVQILYERYLYKGYLAVNAAILLACSALALFLCEFFLRRRDARSNPGVPT